MLKLISRFDSGPPERRRGRDDGGPGSARQDNDGGRGARKAWSRGDDLAGGRGERKVWGRGEDLARRGSKPPSRGYRGAGGEKPENEDVTQSLKVQEMLRERRALIEVRLPGPCLLVLRVSDRVCSVQQMSVEEMERRVLSKVMNK